MLELISVNLISLQDESPVSSIWACQRYEQVSRITCCRSHLFCVKTNW